VHVLCRYNCNRYNEDEAKKARDAQEVGCHSVNVTFSIIASSYIDMSSASSM